MYIIISNSVSNLDCIDILNYMISLNILVMLDNEHLSIISIIKERRKDKMCELESEDKLLRGMVQKVTEATDLVSLKTVLREYCVALKNPMYNGILIQRVYESLDKLEGNVGRVFRDYLKLIDATWNSTYTCRCRNTYRKILELEAKGDIERAELLTGVLLNRNETAAYDLSEVIDKVDLSNKRLVENIKSGEVSPRKLYRNKDLKKEKKVCNKCGKERSLVNFSKGANTCIVCKQNDYYKYNQKKREYKDVLGREIKDSKNIDYNMLDNIVQGLKEEDNNKESVISLDLMVSLSEQMLEQLEIVKREPVEDGYKLLKIKNNIDTVLKELGGL